MWLWPLKMPTQNFLVFVSVADVDAEECVADSLIEILMLTFGKDFEPWLWSQYWSWNWRSGFWSIFLFLADVWLSFWGLFFQLVKNLNFLWSQWLEWRDCTNIIFYDSRLRFLLSFLLSFLFWGRIVRPYDWLQIEVEVEILKTLCRECYAYER